MSIKRNYNLSHKLIACILSTSLFLQSCVNSLNQVTSKEEEPKAEGKSIEGRYHKDNMKVCEGEKSGKESKEEENEEQEYLEDLRLAQQGDIGAKFNLGVRYANGIGTAQDNKTAVEWYQRAADQGDLDAQYNLGIMYVNGTGVEKDDKRAVKWFQKAAEKKHARAQNYLGFMYQNGCGIDKNYVKAREYYQQAADQGDPNAQNHLRLIYDNGRGVLKDEQQSFYSINTEVEYDENMILMVWDSYIKSQGEIQYFISDAEYLETLFKEDGIDMAAQKSAGLLVKKGTNELYLNNDNKSVSICGTVDYKKSKVKEAKINNLEVALEQIRLWNNKQINLRGLLKIVN